MRCRHKEFEPGGRLSTLPYEFYVKRLGIEVSMNKSSRPRPELLDVKTSETPTTTNTKMYRVSVMQLLVMRHSKSQNMERTTQTESSTTVTGRRGLSSHISSLCHVRVPVKSSYVKWGVRPSQTFTGSTGVIMLFGVGSGTLGGKSHPVLPLTTLTYKNHLDCLLCLTRPSHLKFKEVHLPTNPPLVYRYDQRLGNLLLKKRIDTTVHSAFTTCLENKSSSR